MSIYFGPARHSIGLPRRGTRFTDEQTENINSNIRVGSPLGLLLALTHSTLDGQPIGLLLTLTNSTLKQG